MGPSWFAGSLCEGGSGGRRGWHLSGEQASRGQELGLTLAQRGAGVEAGMRRETVSGRSSCRKVCGEAEDTAGRKEEGL